MDLGEYELWNNGLEVGTVDKLADSRDIPEGQVAGKGSGVLCTPKPRLTLVAADRDRPAKS